MVAVERVVTLDHPLEDVVRYLADFSNTREWDPGTVTCERLGSGPVAERLRREPRKVFQPGSIPGRASNLRGQGRFDWQASLRSAEIARRSAKREDGRSASQSTRPAA